MTIKGIIFRILFFTTMVSAPLIFVGEEPGKGLIAAGGTLFFCLTALFTVILVSNFMMKDPPQKGVLFLYPLWTFLEMAFIYAFFENAPTVILGILIAVAQSLVFIFLTLLIFKNVKRPTKA